MRSVTNCKDKTFIKALDYNHRCHNMVRCYIMGYVILCFCLPGKKGEVVGSSVYTLTL